VDIIRIEFSLRSINTDTTNHYGPIITVCGVGGDFSQSYRMSNKRNAVGAYSYASTQSDQSAIITPPLPYTADTVHR